MNFGNIVIMMSKFGSKSGDFAQRGNFDGWKIGSNPINGYNWAKPFNDFANQQALFNNLTLPSWYRFEF